MPLIKKWCIKFYNGINIIHFRILFLHWDRASTVPIHQQHHADILNVTSHAQPSNDKKTTHPGTYQLKSPKIDIVSTICSSSNDGWKDAITRVTRWEYKCAKRAPPSLMKRIWTSPFCSKPRLTWWLVIEASKRLTKLCPIIHTPVIVKTTKLSLGETVNLTTEI